MAEGSFDLIVVGGGVFGLSTALTKFLTPSTHMQGTFELKTPHDLLQKLRHDLDELKRNPTSAYIAFNFFVTAEHMKDWTFPGRANRATREDLQDASPVLQVLLSSRQRGKALHRRGKAPSFCDRHAPYGWLLGERMVARRLLGTSVLGTSRPGH